MSLVLITIISLSDLKEIIKDPANSSERIIKMNKFNKKNIKYIQLYWKIDMTLTIFY